MPAPTPNLIGHALSYAARGWHVLPCKPQGKTPLTAHGLKDATTDPEQIRAWWTRWPDANIAITTGTISGLVVVDVDADKDGETTLELLEAVHGPLPETVRAITGGDGWHHLYQHPGDEDLRNTAGKLGAGIDTRGDGGYIVVPPSVHSSGQRYEWAVSPAELDLAPLPGWVHDALVAPVRPAPAALLPMTPSAGQTTPYAQRALEERAREVAGAGEGTRNHTLNQAAFRLGQLVAGGQVLRDVAVDELTRAAHTAGLDATEISRTIQSGLEAGERDPQYPDPARARPAPTPVAPVVDDNDDEDVDDEPARASVVINGRPLRDITGELLHHLADANRPPVVYVRAGELTRVRLDENHRPLVEGMDNAHLRERVAAIVDTVRVLKDGGRTHVPISHELARDVGALPTWGASFPPLEAVTEIPTLRRDGTIHAEAGYDPVTRLLHIPAAGLHVPPIPDSPTDAELDAAVALLDEAVGDFPFDGAADQANAIAAILTPLLRPAIDGHIPLALMDAPEPGTGKGLLANLVTAIATGRPAAIKPLPDREEEVRKMLTSTLLEGPTVVVLDNVEDAIRSPALAAVLTSDIWADRILGRSEITSLPNRATWIATGNNLQVAGDLARRCYRIRLDAHQAKPYTRTGFRHPDLIVWAIDHRAELLGALLTIARSWYAAGKPEPLTPIPVMGGYTPWAQTIGGILAHIGIPGFLGNLRDFMESSDQEAAEWEGFLVAWTTRFDDRVITVSDVALELESMGTVPLREALPSAISEYLGKSSFKQMLGTLLTKRGGRHYGDEGYHLVSHPKDRRRVALWSVETREAVIQPSALDVENVTPMSGYVGDDRAGLHSSRGYSQSMQEKK